MSEYNQGRQVRLLGPLRLPLGCRWDMVTTHRLLPSYDSGECFVDFGV